MDLLTDAKNALRAAQEDGGNCVRVAGKVPPENQTTYDRARKIRDYITSKDVLSVLKEGFMPEYITQKIAKMIDGRD